jgi:Fe-S-cluster containining protein
MDGATPATITATAELAVSGRKLSVQLTVPTGPTRPRQLLPLYRELAESFVAVGVANAAEEHRHVSCTKGCGACCRQLVPISEMEARRITEVIDDLPEARRTQVRDRFDAARRQLADAGLLDVLEHCARLTPEEARASGLRYFAQAIACPFLEDESCSIYEERPIACREYLVTSPPANCSAPTANTISCVAIPVSVSKAIRWLTAEAGATRAIWLPLILAPFWAADHADEPERTGPDLLRELFRRLSSQEITEPPL